MIFPRSEVGVQAEARGFFSKRRKALTPALRWAGAGLPDALHCGRARIAFLPAQAARAFAIYPPPAAGRRSGRAALDVQM